jgi:carboxymethylenebutenolidase
VTFYGGGVTEGRFGFPPMVESAPGLRAPWLGLFGDRDPTIPVESVERLQVAAAGAEVRTEVVRYPDAGHAFLRDGGPTYHEATAADAWMRMLDWFADNMMTGAAQSVP